MKTLAPRQGVIVLTLILAALLLLLLPWLEAGGQELLAGRLDLVAHVLAFSLGALALALGAGVDRRLLKAWMPAGVLLLISAGLASYRFAAMLRIFELATAMTLALALIALLSRIDAEKSRRRLSLLVILTAVPPAAAAVWMATTGSGRGTAGFVNPNHLGAMLVCCLPLALLVERRWRWLGWPVAGILSAGLMATGSRGAMMAGALVAAGLLVGASRHNLWRGRRLVAAVLVTVVLVAVAGGTLWNRFADGTDIYRYDRLRIWPQVVEMAGDAPVLGIGPGQFPYRSEAYNFRRPEDVVQFGREFTSPHSTPLLLLTELGGAGALAVLLGMILSALHVRRYWRQESGPDVRVAMAAGYGLAALGVVSLFDEPLSRPPILLLAAVLLALVLPPAPARRPGAAFWPATGGALLAALLIAMIIQPTRAQALALKAAATSHPARQVELLEAARHVLPGQVHYALAEGELLLEHAAHPLDLKSYARIRVVADQAVALDVSRSAGHLLRARLERRACIELLRTEASCARAAADYRLAVQFAPTDALLLRELAGYHRLLGELDEAEASLERAVALEPAFVRAWSDLVEIARERQAGSRLQSALAAGLEEAKRRALEAVPDSGYARDILRSDAEGGPVAHGGGA